MANGSVSKQGDVVLRRADGTTFDAASLMMPAGGGNISMALTDTDDHVLPDTPCKVAYIQNDWDSAGKVAVGLAEDPTAKMERGQWAQPIFVDNLNKIHVKAVSTCTIVGYYQV